MARAPEENEFKMLTLTEIAARFKYNNDAAIDFAMQHGLIANEMICANCRVNCNLRVLNSNVDRRIWRCPARNCRKIISIRKGSFFEGSHLEIWKVSILFFHLFCRLLCNVGYTVESVVFQILGLTRLWCGGAGSGRGMSHEFIKEELNIGSNHTIVDWNQFCRDICVSYFVNNPQQIGGN